MIGRTWLAVAWLALFMSPLWAADRAAEAPPSSVTIVEFTDFQCPFCARVQPIKQRLMAAYPERLRWEIRHFPLGFHGDAMLAHQAALAAGEQGRFWEMHDLLFANRHALKRDQLLAYAQSLGLDEVRFLADLDSPDIRRRIVEDIEAGRHLGVRGTPTFFINGNKLVGAKPYEAFKSQIDTALGIRPSAQAPQVVKVITQEAVIPVVGDAPTQGADDAPVTILPLLTFSAPTVVKPCLPCRHCRSVIPAGFGWPSSITRSGSTSRPPACIGRPWPRGGRGVFGTCMMPCSRCRLCRTMKNCCDWRRTWA